MLDGGEASPKILEPVMLSMLHYGLDGHAVWSEGPTVLGHLMTRVTPESFFEHLPSYQPDSQLAITADARLDNRDELFSIFRVPSDEQASFTDSELILNAYKRWGADCPKHLLGDFAFAIYDSLNQRLFCARDFFGIKPFYYYLSNSAFVFASDIAALLNSELVPAKLNLGYVHSYLAKPVFFHKELTFYTDVLKILPANWMAIERGKINRQEYWTPGKAAEVRFKNESEYVDYLLELLTNSVSSRIRSAYQIGSHLSSGLDSSTISVITARLLRQKNQDLHTFSWAPPPTPDEYPLADERSIVENISQKERTVHHYTRVTPQDILALRTRDITRHPDELLLYENIISRCAAENGIRVLLSGWGGDEAVAFNGRGYFSDLFRRGHWALLARELYLRTRLHEGNIWQGFRNDTLLPLLPDGIIRLLNPASPLVPRDFPLPATLQAGFAEKLSREKKIPLPNLRERPGIRNNQVRLLTSGHLTKRIESWAANGARSGIEYRYPLLDRRIIEFSLSIPGEMFFKDGWKRYLFRQTGNTLLPDEAQWQRMKVDAAFLKNPADIQIEALKLLRQDIIVRRDLLQSSGFVEPDVLIQGLSNIGSKDPEANRKQTDALRSVWLAYIEGKSSPGR